MAGGYTAGQDIPFESRQAAGRALAAGLKERGLDFSAALGLVRGGVPVAFEVASAFGVPLDVVAVKKLQAPFSEELAIGAACADGSHVLREDIIQDFGVSEAHVNWELEVRLLEARDAQAMYLGKHPGVGLDGLSVVIVDDGIATGATMEAGVISARRRGARTVTVAALVGSRRSCNSLRRVADEVLCLAVPEDFGAVGQFYRHFPQVPDEEVRRLLEVNRAATGGGEPEA